MKRASKKDVVSQSDIDKAAKLFRAFHGKPPRPGQIVGISPEKSFAALEVGPAFAIAYLASGKKYFHKFNKHNRPLVFVSSDGRQIVILKGGSRFTARGFIG